MHESVPRVGQAFTYPVVLRTGAGAVIADPVDSVTPANAYEGGALGTNDCTVYFGTDTTGIAVTCTQRGGTEVILDIPISAAQHTASPVVIALYDRNGSAYLPIVITLFTIPGTYFTYNGSYIKEHLASDDSVLRHAPVGESGGIVTAGEYVEGDVP